LILNAVQRNLERASATFRYSRGLLHCESRNGGTVDEDQPVDSNEFNESDVFTAWSGFSPALEDTPVGATVRRRRIRRVAVTTTALAVVAGGIIGLGIGVSGPGSVNAAAQVIRGARVTLSQHTVDLVLRGSLSVQGQTVPLSGNGEADLTNQLIEMNEAITTNSQTIVEKMVSADSNLYFSFEQNGVNQISVVVPGKQWVEEPTNGLTTPTGALTSNPLAQIQLLAQRGNAVSTLGSSTIGGRSVRGYLVNISHATMVSAVRRAIGSEGLSPAAKDAVLKSLSEMSPPTLKVWISADGLIRREEVTLGLTVSGVSATGDAVIDFVNYGASVAIETPASSDVVSFNDFVSATQAAG
jgi:hypothetical protein